MNGFLSRTSSVSGVLAAHGFTYEVRIRGTMSLWGSAGISANIAFPAPLLLHVFNDIHGEPLTLGTQLADGTQAEMGTLQPGECVTIPIQNICAAFATCTTETVVACSLAPH